MDTDSKRLSQYIKKAASYSFAMKISGLLLSFVLQVFLARSLGIAEFGVYGFVITLVVFITSITLLGLDKSIIRFLPEYLSKNEIESLSSFMLFSLCIMFFSLIAMFILLVLFQPVLLNLSTPIGGMLLVFLAILIISGVPGNFIAGLLLAMKKPVVSQFPMLVIKPALLILVLFVYMFFETGDLKAVEMLAINSIISMVILFIYLLIFKYKFEPEYTIMKPCISKYKYSKNWLRTSIGFLTITLCNLIITQTDIIMIGSILSSKSVALYIVAVKVSSLLTFFLVSVNTVVAPLISEYYHGNKRHKLIKIVDISTKIISLTTVAAAVAIIIMSEYILSLFGEEYLLARNILIVLCLGHCVNAFTGPVSYIISMTGHQNYVIKILVVSAVTNVILNWFLINAYGIIGAAYATAIATVIWNVCMYVVALKKLNINTVFFKI